MNARELAGTVVGGLLSPVTGLLSAVRHSRMFHPRGIACSASVTPLAGIALGAEALVRFSSAWWKTGEWPDVLGCAVRFGAAPIREHAEPGDQDLLFATTRRPWTLPLAPLTTKQHDFFAQPFYAVSPFESALGRIELRLRPEHAGPPALSRADKLATLVEQRAAVLVLEWAPYRPFWKIGDESRFAPLARIVIDRVVELDQEALRFDPFHAGAGLVPVGYVQSLRRATYAASRWARPDRER